MFYQRRAITLCCGCAAAALMSGEARAADPATAGPVAEIVVTAQKTTQRLIDVPLTVNAVSGAALREAHVDQPMDLVSQVPNVDIKQNIPGAQEIISIRGVGLDDFSATNNSTVGVYVDDVFLASFAQMDFNFYDLDRVEVLKGPQGTLYGRNSTAGAINVISARPALSGFSAEATAGYGNYDDFTADGYVNVPISDDLALRFSGKTDQQGEGYWFSRVLDGRLGRQNNLLGRAQALYKPNDRLTILFKLEGEHDRSSIGVGKFFGTIPAVAGAVCPDFSHPANCVNSHGYTDTTPNPFTGDWNHPAPYDVDQLNATLHIDDDLGWAKLSSVTGYIDFKRGFYTDADAGPTTDAEFDENDHVRQFSQELRLAGDLHGVKWLVGGYYSWDEVRTNTPGFLTDLFNTDVLITADQKTQTGAIFGQTEWPITQRLSLTTGLRYTDETRSYVGGTTDTNPNGVSFLCFVAGACALGAPGPHVLSFENASIGDQNVSWRVALDFKPTDQSLLYVSATRGEKSGGFFDGITTNSAALAPFKPEILTDYEAGAKGEFWDRRLIAEASVFYYDYRDLQTQTFTSVGAVSLIKLGNVPKASLYGLDADVSWRAAEGLTLKAGLGLLHSSLGAFPTQIGGATVIIPAGNKLPDAPALTFNGSVRYEHAVGASLIGAIQFDAHYEGAVFKEALNTPYLNADAYWIENAEASVSTANRAWTASLWVKNLSNTEYVTQATDDGLGMGYRVFNPPRTFGATISHRFD
ncbi:MAG TPA: TonB-dependent receptor [Caulobacteraceae bacterium]|jgi:iron complex outermembrane receptor protein|nr:TonB-dependent receptor [Caulobacteraceae bacterium]